MIMKFIATLLTRFGRVVSRGSEKQAVAGGKSAGRQCRSRLHRLEHLENRRLLSTGAELAWGKLSTGSDHDRQIHKGALPTQREYSVSPHSQGTKADRP